MLNEYSDIVKNLQGYKLYLPKTAEVQNVARLVIFVKESVNVTILTEYMDTEVAAIWLKCGARGRKPVFIAGMYREHKFLFQGPETGTERAQYERFIKFVNTWKLATPNKEVIILGDLNLDILKWNIQEYPQKKLVDKVKLDIEMSGYQQLVQGPTCSWPGQTDSLLDHVWVNTPDKIISVQNIVRAFSDHNLVMVILRLKGQTGDRHDKRQRDMKNWDPIKYCQEVGEIDWAPLLAETNINIINDIFENNLLRIMDKMCPEKNFQNRKNNNNWMTDELKTKLLDRDLLREIARVSKLRVDWEKYRVARNLCVKEIKKS